MPGALDGVRILYLATMVAGPVATMMLADQGADVIMVESPHGDLMRHFSSGRNVTFYWVVPTDLAKTGFKISFPGDPLVVDFYYVVVQ